MAAHRGGRHLRPCAPHTPHPAAGSIFGMFAPKVSTFGHPSPIRRSIFGRDPSSWRRGGRALRGAWRGGVSGIELVPVGGSYQTPVTGSICRMATPQVCGFYLVSAGGEALPILVQDLAACLSFGFRTRSRDPRPLGSRPGRSLRPPATVAPSSAPCVRRSWSPVAGRPQVVAGVWAVPTMTSRPEAAS